MNRNKAGFNNKVVFKAPYIEAGFLDVDKVRHLMHKLDIRTDRELMHRINGMVGKKVISVEEIQKALVGGPMKVNSFLCLAEALNVNPPHLIREHDASQNR